MGLDPGRPGSLLTRASQNPPSRNCLEIRNGSRIGATKRPRGVKEVPIGCLLAPKKSARDTFCYFPNSFERGILGSSRLQAGADLGSKAAACYAHYPCPPGLRTSS